MAKVILSLGSNLPDRKENLLYALKKIDENVGKILKISSIYQTDPWGFEAENRFLNMAIMVDTNFSPHGLIKQLNSIEKNAGRTKKTSTHYESRPLDIDIIFYDEEIYYDKDLQIPHKHAHKRKFVLIPIAEICPNFVHPIFKKTILEILQFCNDNKTVELLEEIEFVKSR